MGADSPAENTQKSAQAQRFELFEKKLSLGVRSPLILIS